MHVHKAVIPAAGIGTRTLPASKSISKEMLPVLDRPTIQYVVEEASDAGADDVLLITSREKRSIEDHFDLDPNLESHLKSLGKFDVLRPLAELLARTQIHCVRQPRQRGLGDAVLQARRHVGDDPFLCLLGDTLFSGGENTMLPARQLAAAFDAEPVTLIGLEQVPEEKVSRYGIAGGNMIGPGIMEITALVEKPTPTEAPSRLAIAARYLLTPDIFNCLQQTQPGKGGEIQLTDALRLLLEKGHRIRGVVLAAGRNDIGNPLDWLRANLRMARNDSALWKQLRPLVMALLEQGQ